MYYTYFFLCTGLYQYMLVCTSTYLYVLYLFLPVGIFRYKLEHARMSILLHSHTALYPLVLFWIRGGTRRYKAVKFGTRRYKAVPESPVPLDSEVQGGTRPCTFMCFLVPHYPGYWTFWYCLVPHCTKFHCLVPPCTASNPEEDKRIQGSMRVYQNGHPGMFQFVSVYSSRIYV